MIADNRSSAYARLRDYAAHDRDGCLAVFDSNVPAYFMTAERDAFAAFLDELPGPYLVLTDAGARIVACGGYAVVPGTGVADLCWGMVDQQRHRTGLGRALTEARLRRIRADGNAHEIALNTSQLTQAFYERMGFVTVEFVPDGFATGLHRCDMRLTL